MLARKKPGACWMEKFGIKNLEDMMYELYEIKIENNITHMTFVGVIGAANIIEAEAYFKDSMMYGAKYMITFSK